MAPGVQAPSWTLCVFLLAAPTQQLLGERRDCCQPYLTGVDGLRPPRVPAKAQQPTLGSYVQSGSP